ncbi:MAG: YgiQ family radical SAM protein, partial [Victivallaceae bacterium]|nr:YgiQ family radical SAM protein [Victivallaceae bacterium]
MKKTSLAPPFIPMSKAEMFKLGWDELDILLVTGDCYVDHPSYGISLIGRLMLDEGFRCGIIAQPDWRTPQSLQIMGRPRLACAISSGNMDSMVNLYTAGRRLRRDDAYSEDGAPGLRPPHALIVYSQLARRAFPGLPILNGGMEASLRRVAHYDYWQDKLRPGVLVDSKAELGMYGQGERTTIEVCAKLDANEPLRGIRGTVYLLGKKEAEIFDLTDYVELPDWEIMQQDRDALMTETIIVEREMNPYTGSGLYQRYGERILILEPPPEPLTTEELDRVHELPYSRQPHPQYKKRIPAFDAVSASIPAVRGCPGGCSFCGLVSHQGRAITSRSPDSVMKDVMRLIESKNFKGTISDIGGAAGNIYGSRVKDVKICHRCRRSSCLVPKACPNYVADGLELLRLMRRVSSTPGVKHLYINSGIRLDLAVRQKELMSEMVRKHVSGHMKVAPEHLHPEVLRLMRKNSAEDFYRFMTFFEEESRKIGKEQYLIPLFISNFPGCTDQEMKTVDDFLNRHNWSPQQVQDYIPLPMTMGAAMYYTGKTPDGNPITVNRGLAERRPQIQVLKKKRNHTAIRKSIDKKD